MMPSVDKLAAWARHYATLQGVGDWRFSVEIVPGLKHEGSDAWAVVVPDASSKTARVKVRDLDKTPIPGFDGDPLFEIRVTLSHEMFHLLTAEWIASPTVENEERLVECAAQAVVRSEMTPDARIVARSIKAIPERVRARVAKVSALASRARPMQKGRSMDAKAVLAAITGQDEAAALKILTEWAAEQISEAAGGGEPPQSQNEPPVQGREEPNEMGDPKKPGEQPAARPVAREDENARRARKAADSLNRSAIRARIHEVRTVDGVTLSPELEKLIMGETDIDAAEKLLKVAALSRGDGSPARARGAETTAPAGSPPPAHATPGPDEASLIKEGINATLARHIAETHKTDPRAASATLTAARARLAPSTGTWAKPAGGN